MENLDALAGFLSAQHQEAVTPDQDASTVRKLCETTSAEWTVGHARVMDTMNGLYRREAFGHMTSLHQKQCLPKQGVKKP